MTHLRHYPALPSTPPLANCVIHLCSAAPHVVCTMHYCSLAGTHTATRHLNVQCRTPHYAPFHTV